MEESGVLGGKIGGGGFLSHINDRWPHLEMIKWQEAFEWLVGEISRQEVARENVSTADSRRALFSDSQGT